MARKWKGFDDWDRPSRNNRDRRWTTGVAVGVAVYVLGVLTGALFLNRPSVSPVTQWTPNNQGTAPQGNAQQNAVQPGQSGNVITQIYQSAKNSIVTITAVTGSSSKDGPSEDIGTGFLINSDGDIATNAHVVNGQNHVSVTLSNNKTVPGIVIGTDTIDDLAVVHIAPPAGISPLPLGSTKNMVPGQMVVAIGNPFNLTESVSSGIVSGLNRSMPTETGHVMNGLLQTDAALNPGNSGGPLFNEQGQVVGINTAIESPVQGSVGIGFAIPIDRLEELLPQLLKGNKISHSWLGITGIDIVALVQQQLHLPVDQGVLVITTTKDGPAAKAGLHGDSGGTNNPKGDGDIITGLNGKSIPDIASLTAAISAYPPGTVVHLSILRAGKPMTVNVTLGTWPDAAQ